jgi:hypothetical protein
MDNDTDLKNRLVAMESRLETPDPPHLQTRKSRHFALSFVSAPLLILVLAGTAVAGAVVLGQAQGAPGVENPGQPLAGAGLECMTPPRAQTYLAAHGFTAVVWQVEKDAPALGGSGKAGSASVQQSFAPQTGIVVPGSIIDGKLYMVVDQRQGALTSGNCSSR